MNKRILLLAGIFLLLATNVLNAQDANKILNNFYKSLKSHKNIEVSFTLQEISNGKVQEEEEVTAYFQKDAYKLLSESQHIISDGKVVWTYLPEEQEVMVSNVTENDINPLQLLTEMEEESIARPKGTDNLGDNLVELFDTDGDPMGILLKFNKKGELRGIEMTDEESTMRVNISEIKYDQDWPKGFFTFDEKAYPGVEIIDMR